MDVVLWLKSVVFTAMARAQLPAWEHCLLIHIDKHANFLFLRIA